MANQQCLFLVSNVFVQDSLRIKRSRILITDIAGAAIHAWLGHKIWLLASR